MKTKIRFPENYAHWALADGPDKLAGELCKCGHLRLNHRTEKNSTGCKECRCNRFRHHCYVKRILPEGNIASNNKALETQQEIAQVIAVAKKYGYGYVINQIKLAWSKEGDPK